MAFFALFIPDWILTQFSRARRPLWAHSDQTWMTSTKKSNDQEATFWGESQHFHITQYNVIGSCIWCPADTTKSQRRPKSSLCFWISSFGVEEDAVWLHKDTTIRGLWNKIIASIEQRKGTMMMCLLITSSVPPMLSKIFSNEKKVSYSVRKPGWSENSWKSNQMKLEES